MRAGADAVCPGSAVFGNEYSPSENVKKMKNTIKNLTSVRLN